MVASICEHKKYKHICKICSPHIFCECDKRRSNCKKHGGGNLCPCGISKFHCRICSDDKKTPLIRSIISNSRISDKKHERYDQVNFIDTGYLKSLFGGRDDLYCPYCRELMSYLPVKLAGGRTITIQRKDNRVGHTKDNTIFCCHNCNKGRAELRIHLCSARGCTTIVDALGDRCLKH